MKLLPIQRGKDGMYSAEGVINGRRFVVADNTLSGCKALRFQQIQITLNAITEAK